MKAMSIKSISDQRVAQLIDANLDRAREGIRVVEEWCRFSIQEENLVRTLKDFRHQLAKHHHLSYKNARCTSTDTGIGLTHPYQKNRESPEDLIQANCSRVQEALRVLEEFAKGSDPDLSKEAASIRYQFYEIELDILKKYLTNERKDKLNNCNLCLITNSCEDLTEKVTESLKAGIKMIQYRDKYNNDNFKYFEAKKIAALCKDFGALFIVNDRIDLALSLDADGIHLGQNDLPIKIARELVGSEKIIGVSTHSIEEIKKAETEGPDYLGIGPIYPTKSKPNKKPLGVKILKEASLHSKTPLFAIGSINEKNINDVISNGVKRCAVIGAIMNSHDAFSSSQKLLDILK